MTNQEEKKEEKDAAASKRKTQAKPKGSKETKTSKAKTTKAKSKAMQGTSDASNISKSARKRLKNTDFLYENDVENYIFDNIDSFCSDILGDKLIRADRQLLVKAHLAKKDRGKCMDIFIEAEKYNYIVEIKHPSYAAQNISAIGQLLSYGILKTDSIKENRLILVSTLYDENTKNVIEAYHLPITYMIICKEELVVII